MNRLTAFGVYYVVLGMLMFLSLTLYMMWWLVPVGVVMIVLDFSLRRMGVLPLGDTALSDTARLWANGFLAVFPFLPILFVFGIFSRPFNRMIVLPDGYRGLIKINYGRPDGQAVAWSGGIPYLGADRLIRVAGDGVAVTQAKHPGETFPILNAYFDVQVGGGARIYYESDLNRQIVPGADGLGTIYLNPDARKPSLFFIASDYPTQYFVVDYAKNYCTYFEGPIKEDLRDYEPDEAVSPGCFISPWATPNDSLAALLPEHILN